MQRWNGFGMSLLEIPVIALSSGILRKIGIICKYENTCLYVYVYTISKEMILNEYETIGALTSSFESICHL